MVAKWRKRNPWFNSLRMARERCNRKGQQSYPYYGGKGIKCLLTAEDAKFLWKRDGADKMLRPSIDRLKETDHYTRDTCRFIELRNNVGAPKRFARVGGSE